MSLRSVQWSQQIIYEIVFDINEPRERPQESESLIGCHLFGNLPGVNVMTTISPLIKGKTKEKESIIGKGRLSVAFSFLSSLILFSSF